MFLHNSHFYHVLENVQNNGVLHFLSPNNTSSNCFHRIEKRIPCKPFARILVSKPRKKRPCTPDSAITLFTTCGYDKFSGWLCLYTFTTRTEFEHVSDTAEAQNPRIARRPSSASCVSCLGIFSLRKLYVKNHLCESNS